MVKKSRRQREGTERVYPGYNVVDEDVSGQNTDSVETSIACDESSSTMFQPKASIKSRGVLRLQKKTSQYKSPKLGGGPEDRVTGRSSPPTMHAVANGERMEAFKTGERETANGSDSADSSSPLVGPAGTEARHAAKRPAFDRPCPKSRKLRDGEEPQGAQEAPKCESEPALVIAGTTQAGGDAPDARATEKEGREDVRDEKEEADECGEVQGEDQHVNGVTEECNPGDSSTEPSVNGNDGSKHRIEESEHGIEGNELGIEESEHGIEGCEQGVEGSEQGKEGSEQGIEGSEQGIEGSEHGIEGSEQGIEGSEQGIEGSEQGIEGSEEGIEESEHGIEGSEHGIEGSEHGNEGIVTEPEEPADQESCNVSNPDVTISFLEGEEEGGSEPERGGDPLIEFPTDSPGKTSRSPHPIDAVDSDIDDGIDTDFFTSENMPDSDDPMEEDSPDTSMDRGYKVLHRLLNPTQYRTGAGETKRADYATEELRKEREPDFSFGRSLRSLSGRRAMKPRGVEEGREQPEASPTDSGSPSFFNFSFGKRKAEVVEEEHEAKRAKADVGVDSLGFLARLTSPVINRLRAIRVGSPFRTAGEEVTGHEEMAVAIVPTAQPASNRCILM